MLNLISEQGLYTKPLTDAERTALQNTQVVVTPPGPPATYNQLKARQEELANQLESVQDRREQLSQQAHQKSGKDRDGIESRIQLLDRRIEEIETDLASVGRQAALVAPTSTVEPPTRTIFLGYGEDAMWGAGFAGASLMFALFVPFLIRNFRRRRFSAPATTQPVIGAERIDRMEHAIDSIAVEIERVSENQRFMTRLMTETQLAGSLAAVRGSTEAARAAAEGQSNV